MLSLKSERLGWLSRMWSGAIFPLRWKWRRLDRRVWCGFW